MRVAIDCNARYVIQTGVARYLQGLVRGLRQVAAPDVNFFEFAWAVENFAYRQPQRILKTFYRELIWAKFIAPSLLAKQQAELLHSAVGYFVKPPKGIKNIVTLHDLAFIRFPARFRKWQGWAGRRNLRRVLTADRVICISQFTADEAMTLLGLPAAKIDVVYNGCEFHPDDPAPPEQKPDFAVPPEFFLFVGSLEPGKNLALLRQTYELAAQKNIVLPPLLIVGARWLGVAAEGAPPRNWHYLGRQPDDVLVFLYRRALALAFPSKYEGFGLPVVEAMALRCPVVCAPVASLREVGGEAPLYTKLDPTAYCEALRSLSQDATLRSEMIVKGANQARQFSWRKCAAETASVYRKVAV